MTEAIGNPVRVLAVPAFRDNYIWVAHDGANAVVIDPGEAAPVIAALAAHALRPTAILLTHHHADHVGGVPALLERWTVPVYGPAGESIATVTHPLADGEPVHLDAPALSFDVIDVPGHTRGHIAYMERERGWLFCGDTLFAGGCGRLFEGTAAQMAQSLSRLAALPDDTAVYCAHEYTLSNLRFAREAEPNNAALTERIGREQAKRDQGVPTVPTSIRLEKATNPFLRTGQATVVDTLIGKGLLGERDPVAAFAALRSWKDNF